MFSVYLQSSGEIVKQVACPDFLLDPNTPADCSAILGGYDDALFRVDITQTPHAAVPKTTVDAALSKATIAADGVDVCEISGIPAAATVTVESQSTIVEDGVLAFATDFPGVYRFTITHPLWLDTVVEVIAQ